MLTRIKRATFQPPTHTYCGDNNNNNAITRALYVNKRVVFLPVGVKSTRETLYKLINTTTTCVRTNKRYGEMYIAIFFLASVRGKEKEGRRKNLKPPGVFVKVARVLFRSDCHPGFRGSADLFNGRRSPPEFSRKTLSDGGDRS